MRRFLLMLGMALCVIAVQARVPAFSGAGSFRDAVSDDETKIDILDVSGVFPLLYESDDDTDMVEKTLYSTDFTEWGDYETSAKESVTTATWKTNYSKETLTFSIYNTQISTSNFNESKFPDWTGGMLMAAKSDTPYILTSALNSITKVHFMHGATGSNRGWKLEVMGDGDSDWVVVSETVASPAAGCDVTVDVNRTNCMLRFTNLNSSQNAYLMELDIYGLVDMSATPALGTFTYNGVTYEAAEIFEDASTDTMTATIELDNSVDLPSESNPVTDLTFDNGSLQGDVTYETTTNGVVVTIVVTANNEEMTYIATFVHKPYYVLTYYNTDGSVLESTQQVEKDAAITTLRDSEGVTVEDGKAFRGWFVSAEGGQKYTVEDVVISDLDLYAVATDIEVESTTARYTYTLTDKYFYDEDHEAFNPDGAAFHDTTHGWSMNTSDKIDLLVGGHAYIIVTLCSYSSSSAVLTLTNELGETVTASGYSSKDGTATAIEYTGSAGTLTLTTSALVYLHKLIIANVEDAPVEENEQGYYVVNAGDADNLLTTLDVVNAKASSSSRTYVFLPNGTYDLGDAVLTPISGDNISIIGQDIDNTIIVNKAPEEGISVSATFLITGSNTYIQDLTLQNAYDYYNAGNAGRAVVIQDKGDRTICKNVKMLSYQDTYYSNSNGQYYFENSDIHGTVDFICGSGDVYFNECTLTIEPRKTDGTGECTITAPATSTSAGNNFGYVFNYCTIDNQAASFNFGRAWNNTPRCAYLNTTIQNDKLASNRWTLAGMNVVADKFVEYNTMDESGNVTSPSSKQLTFTYGTTSSTYETILTDDEAEEYALENVFTDWTPAECTVQKVMGTVSIDDTQLNLSWDAVDGAIAYAIFKDGVYVDMTTTNSYVMTEGETGDYTVRAANEYGGFGDSSNTTTGIKGVVATDGHVVDTIYYNVQGIRVNPSSEGVLIKIETLEDGTKNVTKVVR